MGGAGGGGIGGSVAWGIVDAVDRRCWCRMSWLKHRQWLEGMCRLVET